MKSSVRKFVQNRAIGCFWVCLLGLSGALVQAGQLVYVDCDRQDSKQLGTPEDPYLSVGDGIAHAGEYGWIMVAECDCHEKAVLLQGQTLEGGYRDDWSVNDPELYISRMTGDGDLSQAVVTMSSRTRLSGMTVSGCSTGIRVSGCQGFFIERTLVTDLTVASIEDTGGSMARGIVVENSGRAGWLADLYHVSIRDIAGGPGPDGSAYHYTGLPGGDAAGVWIVDSSAVIVEGIEISGIQGGRGGSGSADNYQSAGGGSGGNAFGIVCTGQNDAIIIDTFQIAGLRGGNGGTSPWGHLQAGNGGAGGDAAGIRMDEQTVVQVMDGIIGESSGGNGAEGGDSGDCPGSGHAGRGGDGGAVTGIASGAQSEILAFNLLIHDLTGGAGGGGGDTFQSSGCGSGGHGGDAAGIRTEHGSPWAQCITVDKCSGGPGGIGGRSHFMTSSAPNAGPSDRDEDTPTPTPTYFTCQGGNGGDGSGMKFIAGQIPDVLYNIITRQDGGVPGMYGTPVPGSGHAVCGPAGAGSVSYLDMWMCQDGLQGYWPGEGTFNLDPIFASDNGFEYCISQTAAGQSENSPCLDAGDVSPEHLFPSDRYTTRTDGVVDEGWLDFGFHRDSLPDPTRTPIPAMTPGITPTPTSGTETSPTPTPTSECPDTGVTIHLNLPDYGPGDPFTMTGEFCNGDQSPLTVDFALMLDIYGMYFFYPAWTEEFAMTNVTMPPCGCLDYVFLDFCFPDDFYGSFSFAFWFAMFETGTFNLIGNIDYMQTFYYS